MSALVLAEHDHGILVPATRIAIAAAGALDEDVHVLVAGRDCDSVVRLAAETRGVSKVLRCDDARYKHFRAEPLAELIGRIGNRYGHIVAAATTFGKNVLPRVAALLDVAAISDIVGIESPDTFRRPIYAGNAIATVQSQDAVKVITVRTTAFDAAPAEGGDGLVEDIPPAGDPGTSRFISQALTESEPNRRGPR